jgi:ubiquinone/menaquinone biosynthesis C-methylase UbiE
MTILDECPETEQQDSMVQDDKALRTEAEIQAAYESNDVATNYIDRRFVAPLMAQLHDRQVALINTLIAGKTKLLEIAPGPGRLTRAVRTSGHLTCLEFNAAMIEQAQPACSPGIRWIRGNAFDLPFDGEFDCAYSFRFVRHFEAEDRGRLYAQIARALRPGGLFIMDAINERVSLPHRRANPNDYVIYDKLYRDLDELRQELAAHGFLLEAAYPVLQWFWAQSSLQSLLGPRSDWLCRKLIGAMERLPSGQPLEWVVACRRA